MWPMWSCGWRGQLTSVGIATTAGSRQEEQSITGHDKSQHNWQGWRYQRTPPERACVFTPSLRLWSKRKSFGFPWCACMSMCGFSIPGETLCSGKSTFSGGRALRCWDADDMLQKWDEPLNPMHHLYSLRWKWCFMVVLWYSPDKKRLWLHKACLKL